MLDTNTYLEMLLNDYRNRLRREKQELRRLPDGDLHFRKQNGKMNYVHFLHGADGTDIKTGITRDPDMLSKLSRKKYLQHSIKTLTSEIARLENFISARIEPTPQNILNMLPPKFQTLDEDLFFPQRKFCRDWTSEPYAQNTKNLHEKIHLTSKGLRVRSKSELIIIEKLYEHIVPVRYDSLIYFKGKEFSPDFTFPPHFRYRYWEHCGMMGTKSYRDYNKYKISVYEKMGIVPWKNLIITYDYYDGGINAAEIESIIVNKLLVDVEL